MQLVLDMFLPILFGCMFISAHRHDVYTWKNWKTALPIIAIVGWTSLLGYTYFVNDKGTLLAVMGMAVCTAMALCLVTVTTFRKI